MKYVLYDPITIATAAFTLVGSMSQASALRKQGESEAAMAEAQAEQERKQHARELSDLEAERSRTLARTRAVLAASGADSDDPSLQAITASQSTAFGQQRARLTDDSKTRVETLTSKAANTRSKSKSEANAAIFGGIGKSVSIFGSAPKAGK